MWPDFPTELSAEHVTRMWLHHMHKTSSHTNLRRTGRQLFLRLLKSCHILRRSFFQRMHLHGWHHSHDTKPRKVKDGIFTQTRPTPPPPQPFYGPFSGTTRVSRCQKRTSGLHDARKINRGRHTDHPARRHSIRTNQCPPPPFSPYGPQWLGKVVPKYRDAVRHMHAAKCKHIIILFITCLSLYL